MGESYNDRGDERIHGVSGNGSRDVSGSESHGDNVDHDGLESHNHDPPERHTREGEGHIHEVERHDHGTERHDHKMERHSREMARHTHEGEEGHAHEGPGRRTHSCWVPGEHRNAELGYRIQAEGDCAHEKPGPHNHKEADLHIRGEVAHCAETGIHANHDGQGLHMVRASDPPGAYVARCSVILTTIRRVVLRRMLRVFVVRRMVSRWSWRWNIFVGLVRHDIRRMHPGRLRGTLASIDVEPILSIRFHSEPELLGRTKLCNYTFKCE